MKKLIMFTVFICSVAIIFAGGAGESAGEGVLVTYEEHVPPFNSISISADAIVNYYDSSLSDNKYRVFITVEDSLAKYVKVDIKRNVLRIGAKRGLKSQPLRYKVDVYCPALSLTQVNVSTGSFETVDRLITTVFSSKISGSGKLRGVIECKSFSANILGTGGVNVLVDSIYVNTDISGSGNIEIAGRSMDTKLNISGSGSFMGSDFRTTTANVQISGSGNAYIWVLDDLKARVSGYGNIIYKGSPKIDFRSTGAGHIESY